MHVKQYTLTVQCVAGKTRPAGLRQHNRPLIRTTYQAKESRIVLLLGKRSDHMETTTKKCKEPTIILAERSARQKTLFFRGSRV